MPIRVLIPTPLQQFTDNAAVVELNAVDVNQLIQALDERFPGFKARLCDDKGQLRRFLNIYVNSEDIRFLDHQATPLKEGDEVSIIPAVAGG